MEPATLLSDTRATPPERGRTAPTPAFFPPPAGPCRAGHAEVHAHHGEIVQGLFYSSDGQLEHGLVTLPCPLFATRARFRPLCSGPLTAELGERTRARAAARLTLDALGRTGWGGSLRLESNVPLRWGCGSCTTDVLATVRAVAHAFGAVLAPEWIAAAEEYAVDPALLIIELCEIDRCNVRDEDLRRIANHVRESAEPLSPSLPA